MSDSQWLIERDAYEPWLIGSLVDPTDMKTKGIWMVKNLAIETHGMNKVRSALIGNVAIRAGAVLVLY